MTMQWKRWTLGVVGVLVVAVTGMALWQQIGENDDLDGFASANGRIEATEIDVAARTPGRVKQILVQEGDFIQAGQVLAIMDTAVLEAQQREAQAQLKQAGTTVEIARSQLVLRESEKAAYRASVEQRLADRELARKRAARSSNLVAKGAVSQQVVDDDRARLDSAEAAVRAARAQLAAADAAIAAARLQVSGAQSAVEAGKARLERIEVEIADSTLKAPRDGRVQYRIVQPGEVLAPGAPVLNVVDLKDVYMTFFLATSEAGRVALGTEVRLILDAAPQYVIPARVSFVADVAQFTPKTVETASERQKLMFRIRAQIPVELLEEHITQVKTGLPGMAYVRMDPGQPWPAHLRETVAP